MWNEPTPPNIVFETDESCALPKAGPTCAPHDSPPSTVGADGHVRSVPRAQPVDGHVQPPAGVMNTSCGTIFWRSPRAVASSLVGPGHNLVREVVRAVSQWQREEG